MILEIRLLRFSTGQPHPVAEQPIIFIATKNMFLGCTNVQIEIVGDFLALLINFKEEQDENEDMFYLVHWKKGETYCVSVPRFQPQSSLLSLKLYIQLQFSEWGTYGCFNFLSQDTLVMANLIQNTLEITKIVNDSDMPRLMPLCVLHLPPLTYRASIVRLSCRAEPNPTGPDPLAVPAPSNRPFRDKAEDAIILFHILIEAVLQEPHFLQEHPFTFIVHRSALLAHTPAAHRTCPPFFSSPELAPSQVPWAAWGITETRWFNGNSASMDWITTMAGQRSVTMDDGTSMPIIVRDFNPYAVRAARALATG